ncbi:DNA segregation ATPase FtsK/SpoIIIE [Eubacterium ruminantium]|nr:DNA segregation ATPase FtsK/SpoIIIE [Eubacterium ruminantium]
MAAKTQGSSAIKSTSTSRSSRSSSGTRKSTPNSRSTANRKSSSTSKATKNTVIEPENDPAKAERQKEIYLFAFLAVSVFLLLSNFNLCGVVGRVISGFFFGLFGTITYLIPFYLFFSAAYLLSNGTKKKVLKKIIWIGIALILVAFITQIIVGAEGVTIKTLYLEGYKHKKGGGVLFGGLLSLLYKLIGKVGCIIFSVLFVLVAIIEIINVSLIQLVKSFGSSFKNTANYGRSEDDDEYEYDYYDDDDSYYETRSSEPKHILNNTTILEDKTDLTADDSNSVLSNSGRSKKKKKKKVVYPAEQSVEIADEDVKDIYTNKSDNKVMPDFLKDSHEKVRKNKKSDSTSSEDAYSAISGLSSYGMVDRSERYTGAEEAGNVSSDYDGYGNNGPFGSANNVAAASDYVDTYNEAEMNELTPDLDNGSRVDKEPGKTGIHRREHPIKTDIFDLKPVKDPYASREQKTSFASSGMKKESVDSRNDEYFGSDSLSEDKKYLDDIFEDSDTSNVSEEERLEDTVKTFRSDKNIKSDTVSDNNSAVSSDSSISSVSSISSALRSSGTSDTSSASDKAETAVKKKEYRFPPVSLLHIGKSTHSKSNDDAVRENGIKLKETLESFGVNVTITDYSVGPAVTRYELQPEQGVKVSKIVSLQDDIKLALAAADIRIEAPIPGKPAVGIEIPNKENQKVYFRELIESDKFKENSSKVAFAVGKDIGGQVIVTDIAKMPHLLIAGATGSGKSVCVNTIIMSILYKAKPDDVKLIMVDPKMVELTAYNGIPHLLIPVVTDPKKAAGALNWAVVEMTNRYQLFAKYNVRNIKGFNQKVESEGPKDDDPMFRRLPQIVVIVDELADLMMVAHAEVEDAIIRLCQLARAAGIHLIIATQRPSVDVITGLIKANVPSRIAFAVSSGVDSRTILDMNGAEKLLGKGDMLFYPTGYPKPVRVQGALIEDEEVVSIVEYIKKYNDGSYDESVSQSIENSTASASGQKASGEGDEDRYDEFFEDAARLVIEKDKASIGNLQRVFRIGFNRAARIMDQLAEAGVVGPEEGTKPRKILMTMDQFDDFMSL